MCKRWETARLGDLFILQMGKTPNRREGAYWSDGVNRWIAIADMTGDKYIDSSKESITAAAVSESGIREIPPNTVIMSFKLSVGKVAITRGQMYSNEAIMAFLPRPTTAIDVSFLYYRLLSHRWLEVTNRAVKGLTLNKRILSEIAITFPSSLAEQGRIAQLLDQATDLVKSRKMQLQTLDELAQSTFYSLFGDPISNPKGWQVKTLGEVGEINPRNKIVAEETTVSFIPMASISDGFAGTYTTESRSWSSVKKGFTHIKQGDIGVAKISPCFQNRKSAIFDNLENGFGAATTELHIIRPSDKVERSYLLNLFKSDYFIDSGVGQFTGTAGQQRINTNFFASFPIPLPPLPLQQQFAEIVGQIEAAKACVRRGIQETEDLLGALMQGVFAPLEIAEEQ